MVSAERGVQYCDPVHGGQAAPLPAKPDWSAVCWKISRISSSPSAREYSFTSVHSTAHVITTDVGGRECALTVDQANEVLMVGARAWHSNKDIRRSHGNVARVFLCRGLHAIQVEVAFVTVVDDCDVMPFVDPCREVYDVPHLAVALRDDLVTEFFREELRKANVSTRLTPPPSIVPPFSRPMRISHDP